ncbi:MAG: hypothetical protein ACREA9_30100 [Pyrinomonadaceae bacterium]
MNSDHEYQQAASRSVVEAAFCNARGSPKLAQPTLDVIRRLAVALQVSADVLIFGADERGPDGDLRLQFEAISKFAPEEKKVIKALLEGMILKHEAKRWSSAA